MYEHIDSLYSWAMQHNAQEIAGILVLCLAVIAPIAAIVLAFIDFVLCYALCYVHEDSKDRFLIKDMTRISKVAAYPESVRYLEVMSVPYNDWGKLSKGLREELSNHKDELVDHDGDLITSRLHKLVYEEYFYIYKMSFIVNLVKSLVGIALTLYFLPFYVLLTAATIYGTLRTARFAVRLSKKFNKHMEVEHEEKKGSE